MAGLLGFRAGLLLAIYIILSTHTTESLLHLPKDHLAVQLSKLLPRPDASVTHGDLPAKRPPVGWMCDYSCMQVLHIGTSKGVYELDMTYKPLKSVNSSMMSWLFENLHRHTTSPVDNQTYPMYLVFHGVDHLHHEATPPDRLGVGTVLSWNEIPLTGCHYDRWSATTPWVCPEARSGFVQSDSKSKWADMFHTKVDMTVTRYDANGIEFVRKESNPFFGGNGSRVVVTTRHSWQDSPEGLQLRTQQWLGLMQPHSATDFDTSFIAPVTNMIVKDKYLDGAKNVPKGNITAAAYMAALHYLQEYGSLSNWLPHAYATNNVIH